MMLGFFISATVFYALNRVFPVSDMGQIDDTDIYGTFTLAEARRAGVAPLESLEGRSAETLVFNETSKQN